MRVGDFEVRLINDGECRVDGGAMFGARPKTIWSRLVTSDAHNRVPLAINCLLIETPHKRILVDVGIGAGTPSEFRDLHGLTGVKGMRRRIEEAGLKVDDIDIVLFSHLHYDHVDGALETVGGRKTPVFSRAEYVIQAGEWRDAFNTNKLTAGGYNEATLKILEQTGRVRFIEGDVEVSPGVSVRVTGGHTAHHQIVIIESLGEKAVFLADLIPTAAHLQPINISALDTNFLETFNAKSRLIREAVSEKITCFFSHENDNVAGYVRRRGGGYVLEARQEKET